MGLFASGLLLALSFGACGTPVPAADPTAARDPSAEHPSAGHPSAGPTAPGPSARSVLAELSLEEKAGQVLMCWILARQAGQADARDQMRGWIEDVGLGGVILSLGSAAEGHRLISELQAHARGCGRLPLLMAGDFEAGVAFRLDGATPLGCNMLVGAAGDAPLAREMGRVTAVEGRALGFHWAFAPVVDVNVNPDNPIINVRSFGENPADVARLGAAFVRGMEGAAMLSCAKHFPGHGDVASDSHLVLPTVPGDRARLESTELAPFGAAIDAGVSSIMSGHLAVPGLGEDPAVPATLSSKILGGELRSRLGFSGLVVTDALDMGGVRDKLPPEEVAIRALLAGADVLLMPPDPAAVRDAIAAAVRSGRVPAERLDQAAARVLAAKERVGLLAGRGLPNAAWESVVRDPAHQRLAGSIAARGVTLVRDRLGLVPLAASSSTVLVSLHDSSRQGDARSRREAGFGGALAAAGRAAVPYRLDPESSAAEVGAAVRAISGADVVVAAMHVRVRSYSGSIGLPPALRPVARALHDKRRVVVVSFGNPYLIQECPDVSTYLCAYNDGSHTEAATARILAGLAPVSGRLPVTIPRIAPCGTGLSHLPGSALGTALPADEGFASDLEPRVRALLVAAIGDRVFPGAVALVARRGRVVLHTAVGRETYDADAAPLRPDALFDLASLTKVCATGPAAMRLIARGELALDQRVADLVPAFSGGAKAAVTIRHLMTHTAGLPPYRRFYKTMTGKASIVEAAASSELARTPGSAMAYSDLGMMLLMACLEKASGQDFESVVQREVLGPLGMSTARFGHTGAPVDAMPTERCAWRDRVVRGEVHDENAFAMGGVSGHAGLFGTALDVARVGVAYLGGGRGWLPPGLARSAVARAGVVTGSSRALCWDTFVPGGTGGTKLSAAAFGHTGFTGTSIWCDPRTDVCLVLLTNRVHPSRDGRGIRAVRGAFADLVMGLLRAPGGR